MSSKKAELVIKQKMSRKKMKSKYFRVACLLAFVLGIASSGATGKHSLRHKKGPKPPKSSPKVATWDFGPYITAPNSSVEFSLKFYAPTTPGSYQVILFFGGLDDLVSVIAY